MLLCGHCYEARYARFALIHECIPWLARLEGEEGIAESKFLPLAF